MSYYILRAKFVVFDFDGVFTDNYVITDSSGKEYVTCSRYDSLGMRLLIAYLRNNGSSARLLIVSTEANHVVQARATKLNIECHQAISSKLKFVNNLLSVNSSTDLEYDELVYFGNDLNDISVMRLAGFSAAPADAHPLVKEVATYISPFNGGRGFIRDTVEFLLGDKIMDVASAIF